MLVRGRPTSCNAVCVTQVVHIPYVVEQDEDGTRGDSALVRLGIGAVGDGATPEEAITGLGAALDTLLAIVGPSAELAVRASIV